MQITVLDLSDLAGVTLTGVKDALAKHRAECACEPQLILLHESDAREIARVAGVGDSIVTLWGIRVATVHGT